MKQCNHLKWILTGLAVAGAVLVLQSSQAQVKHGKSRILTTEQLMDGVVKPHCNALKDALKAAPADDKAWEKLAMHAALLNEVSYILMDDGRCPDGIWADAASKTLRQGSADLAKALNEKNFDGAKSAFGSMTKSCKACHDKHKE